jgi:murein DD-endopeptidase MepM/ murein hydrolase activator NlpD
VRPLLATLACVLGALALVQPVSARPGAVDEVVVPEPGALALRWPARGTLTDGFGPRWGRMHLGLDVGILRSLDVTAATHGHVTNVGWLGGYSGYGQVVMVDIGEGFETMYAHLSRIDVEPGAWVAKGERLGLAGCTGSCTGTHLHFELHRGGTPIDPMPFLSR